jgi:error-prone DNA polymerase
VQVLRKRVSGDGILRSSEVARPLSEPRVMVAGCVVCRQATRTAKGHAFLTLEDEDGPVDVVLRPSIYDKYRSVARREPLIGG